MSIDVLREKTGSKAQQQPRERRGGQPSTSWSEIGTGICFASGLYVLVVALVAFCCVLFFEATTWLIGSRSGLRELPALAIGFAGFAFFGAVWAGIYAGLLSLLVFGVAWLSRWLLRGTLGDSSLGIICGGAVAYLATLPLSREVFSEFLQPFPDRWWLAVCALMLVGAVGFGMAGGAIGGIQSERARRRWRAGEPNEPTTPRRFSIAQLMGLMVVVSGLLAVLRAAGLFEMPMLGATLLWLAVQVVAHRPAIWVARCLVHRQQRRWRRELVDRRERLRGRLLAGTSTSRST